MMRVRVLFTKEVALNAQCRRLKRRRRQIENLRLRVHCERVTAQSLIDRSKRQIKHPKSKSRSQVDRMDEGSKEKIQYMQNALRLIL